MGVPGIHPFLASMLNMFFPIQFACRGLTRSPTVRGSSSLNMFFLIQFTCIDCARGSASITVLKVKACNEIMLQGRYSDGGIIQGLYRTSRGVHSDGGIIQGLYRTSRGVHVV